MQTYPLLRRFRHIVLFCQGMPHKVEIAKNTGRFCNRITCLHTLVQCMATAAAFSAQITCALHPIGVALAKMCIHLQEKMDL